MAFSSVDSLVVRPDERPAATPAVEVSIVIPAHDEAESLPPLLAEIEAALAGVAAYEVLVVDDGSHDDTPQRLEEARRRDARVRVLRHDSCAGQSAALRTGVGAARGAWIATLDGDGQNDPADLPRLLALARADGAGPGERMIAGHRRRRQDGLSKRISSRVANGIRRRLLGDETPDTGCGIKVFGRDAFLALPYFDHMHRFLPALFLAAGGRVGSAEVHHRPRAAGRSKYGVVDRALAGIVDLLGVMWLRRRTSRPRVDELA
jgi:dolichol-phosphate mannosyltransferase